jgi:hypothetical protein
MPADAFAPATVSLKSQLRRPTAKGLMARSACPLSLSRFRDNDKKEAIRCPRRYVAREVYDALTHPFELPSREGRGGAPAQSPREARLLAGLTQREAAAESGVSASTISKIENGRLSRRSRSYKRYAAWIDDGMPVDVENPEDLLGKCS